MSPLEFMQRLAALVPRPRLHLIRLHGVLAPNAKLRALVVPQAPDDGVKAAPPTTLSSQGLLNVLSSIWSDLPSPSYRKASGAPHGGLLDAHPATP
jgi:hypothetical protein